MKNRTIATLCLAMGIALTYLLFPVLFDLGAYALPIARIKIIYEGLSPSELPPHLVNKIIDVPAQLFGKYIAGFFCGFIFLIIGIILFRYFMKIANEMDEDWGKLSRHPMQICIAIFCLIVTLNGFFIVGPNQRAMAVHYEVEDYIPDGWAHFIAMKDGRLNTMKVRLVEEKPLLEIFGLKIYWHRPFPLGSTLKFNLHEDFLSSVPLIKSVPVYIYDEEGNIIDIQRDSLNQSVTLGYECWTDDGLKFYSTSTWTDLMYDPKFSLEVLTFDLSGEYDVILPEQYAIQEYIHQSMKKEQIEVYGYYGELVDPLTTVQFLEEVILQWFFLQYMFYIKLPALMLSHNQKLSDDKIIRRIVAQMSTDPTIAIREMELTGIGEIPSFLEFLRYQIIEADLNMNIEEYYGIVINDKMTVQVGMQEI